MPLTFWAACDLICPFLPLYLFPREGLVAQEAPVLWVSRWLSLTGRLNWWVGRYAHQSISNESLFMRFLVFKDGDF